MCGEVRHAMESMTKLRRYAGKQHVATRPLPDSRGQPSAGPPRLIRLRARHLAGGRRLRRRRGTVRPGNRVGLVYATVDHVDDDIGSGGRPLTRPMGPTAFDELCHVRGDVAEDQLPDGRPRRQPDDEPQIRIRARVRLLRRLLIRGRAATKQTGLVALPLPCRRRRISFCNVHPLPTSPFAWFSRTEFTMESNLAQLAVKIASADEFLTI